VPRNGTFTAGRGRSLRPSPLKPPTFPRLLSFLPRSLLRDSLKKKLYFPILKKQQQQQQQQLGAQINKANQNKMVDLYGEKVKTAAGVPGGSFMHVHQAMVNLVGNDLRNASIMLKTGIDVISKAVSGNMKSKKRLTQNIFPDMIIRAKEGVTYNIITKCKFLCSTSTAYQHGEGKFGGGLEVRQEQVRRNYRTAVQYLDLTKNGKTP
jgi:hypothetical protein